MNEIVRRYEEENSQKALYRMKSSDYHTLRYVQWLEAENQRLREALDTLINDVTCLCSEGPDVMRPRDIYDALIKDAWKARQTLAGEGGENKEGRHG